MNTIGTRGNIDMNDLSSVREMIFSRAREKSASLVNEQNEQITASVRNDVMAEARASITPRKISFGGLTQTKKEDAVTSYQGIQPQEEVKEKPQVLKHNIQSVESSTYSATTRDEVMRAARNHYSKRTSVMDCLNFLNTQAAINLANSTKKTSIKHTDLNPSYKIE